MRVVKLQHSGFICVSGDQSITSVKGGIFENVESDEDYITGGGKAR